MDHDVVRRAPLFASLDEQAAETLIESMSLEHLERGDVMFHEGDQGDRLHVIGEGKIKLGRSSNDGRENLLAILGPGEMFGELSLFDPGPRTATATAVAEAQVVSMGQEQLRDFLGAHPDVALTLLAA
ncbi:MAG: cyclic nucleotide-binding domain-containing protein, partial [Dermatophilaceae bacterium]